MIIKRIIYKVKDLIKFGLKKFGYDLTRLKTINRTGMNLNVGCGSYEIDGFISVDLYSEYYYKNKNFQRVLYDMRKDDLPFDKNSVDTIYCSHVIEHIETKFVNKFFLQAFCVLKSNGVLRIACPDSLFLYKILKEYPHYYSWHPMYKSSIDAISCFIDEVSTHSNMLKSFGLEHPILDYNYEDLMRALRIGGEFDIADPGRHINNWDYERVKYYGHIAGFNNIIESKHNGSCCSTLRGNDMDLASPQMTLYVDLIKF